MKFYILIENCCRHFEGVFISPQEIAEHFEIKENKEWTLEELRNHKWLGEYSIYEYDTEELANPKPEKTESDTPTFTIDDLLDKYGKKS